MNRPLYSVIPREQFKATHFDRAHYKKGHEVRINAKDCKVLYCNGTECCAQQFGNLELAKSKYEELLNKIKRGEL